MEQCNPGLKIPVPAFQQDICSQCAQPSCERSSYKDSATQEKIDRHQKLMEFKDPEEDAPQSPLSQYPEEPQEDGSKVHRAEVPGVEEDGDQIDRSVQALAEFEPDTQPQKTDTPSKPEDPWEVPKGLPVQLHREYDDPKEDPWSTEYSGPVHRKVTPGTTIILPERKSK
jgi:hypothetical protein